MNDYLEWRLESCILRSMRKTSAAIGIQVRRVDALFSGPEADLQNGTLDLALGFFSDSRTLEEGTLSETLFEEDNVVIGRRGNPALKRRLTAERFAELDHAAIIYRSEPWGLIDQELASLGLKRRLRLATPHFLTALKAASESNLIACVPEGLAREFEQSLKLTVRALPISLPPFVTRMLWAKRWHEDPASAWLRDQIRQAVTGGKRLST